MEAISFPTRPSIIQEILYKNSIKFFERGVSKPLKPSSMPLKTFI